MVPTRETVVYVDLRAPASVPSLIDYARLPHRGRGRHRARGPVGVRARRAWTGTEGGAPPLGRRSATRTRALAPDERVAAWTSEWARSRYDGAGETTGAETCLYTNTADEQFVLERHGRIVVGSACSGHGFKFAPAVGRTLAALAHDAAT